MKFDLSRFLLNLHFRNGLEVIANALRRIPEDEALADDLGKPGVLHAVRFLVTSLSKGSPESLPNCMMPACRLHHGRRFCHLFLLPGVLSWP